MNYEHLPLAFLFLSCPSIKTPARIKKISDLAKQKSKLCATFYNWDIKWVGEWDS